MWVDIFSPYTISLSFTNKGPEVQVQEAKRYNMKCFLKCIGRKCSLDIMVFEKKLIWVSPNHKQTVSKIRHGKPVAKKRLGFGFLLSRDFSFSSTKKPMLLEQICDTVQTQHPVHFSRWKKLLTENIDKHRYTFFLIETLSAEYEQN